MEGNSRTEFDGSSGEPDSNTRSHVINGVGLALFDVDSWESNAGGNKDLRACWQLTATCPAF